jgi:hypothetical protein
MAFSSDLKAFAKRNGPLLLWSAAAFVFALSRVPFDDEWFSLTLAANTDWEHFWASLRSDLHPPCVALLDRGLVFLGAGRPGMHGLRVLASLGGLFLLRRVVEERTDIGWRWLTVAAFHPVVFFYAGAARWYPFVFLAQSLRCWALFGPRAGTRANSPSVAFVLGAAVGPAAGYLDVWFVLVDCAWLIWAARRRGRTWKAVGLCGLALIPTGLLIGFFAAPAVFSARVASHHVFVEFPQSTLSWAGLGMLGEAHLPFPWLVLAAVLAAPGLMLGMWRLLFRGAPRPFSFWLVVVGLSWTAGTLVMVSHPRYSLLVWVMAAVSLGGLFSGGWLWKAAGVASLGSLALGLGLTVAGHGFVKADLNRISAESCDELLFGEGGSRDLDLAVVPYPRAATFLRRCKGWPRIVTPRMSRHYPDSEEQMEPLVGAVARAERLELVTVVRPSGSLRVTQERVRRLLSKRCERETDMSRRAVEDPHWRLKRLFGWPGAKRFRYKAELWRCIEKGRQ